MQKTLTLRVLATTLRKKRLKGYPPVDNAAWLEEAKGIEKFTLSLTIDCPKNFAITLTN